MTTLPPELSDELCQKLIYNGSVIRALVEKAYVQGQIDGIRQCAKQFETLPSFVSVDGSTPAHLHGTTQSGLT